MPKPLSIAMIVVGAILLVFASFAGDSISSGISAVFNGTPDTRTIVLLAAGALLLITGITGAIRSSKAS